MPSELREEIEARQIVKAHEKKVNQEIRRLAEEEILKEAEKYYRENSDNESSIDFQKTNKNLSFLPLILSQA